MFVSASIHKMLRVEARQRRMRWNALMVLNDLNLLGPCTHRALAEIEQIRAPTLTVLVQQMEARGWVSRTQSETDARVSLVCITDKGRAEMQRSNAHLQSRVDEELKSLSAGMQAALGRGLLPLARELMRGLHQHPVLEARSPRRKVGEST